MEALSAEMDGSFEFECKGKKGVRMLKWAMVSKQNGNAKTYKTG